MWYSWFLNKLEAKLLKWSGKLVLASYFVQAHSWQPRVVESIFLVES